jgi:hypothetical protein
MERSLSVRSLVSLQTGTALTVFGCSQPTPTDPAAGVVDESSPLHNFCGNGRCDHGETCTTCSQDCGSCGGSGGSGGTGGTAGICGSTTTPPAHYSHVVIFSFENRTWSNVGLGFSASTMPYLHSLASQCSFFSDWTETNTSQNSLTQYIGETAA